MHASGDFRPGVYVHSIPRTGSRKNAVFYFSIFFFSLSSHAQRLPFYAVEGRRTRFVDRCDIIIYRVRVRRHRRLRSARRLLVDEARRPGSAVVVSHVKVTRYTVRHYREKKKKKKTTYACVVLYRYKFYKNLEFHKNVFRSSAFEITDGPTPRTINTYIVMLLR